MPWEFRGFRGPDEGPPDCLNTEKGTAWILGGGRTVWSELQYMESNFGPTPDLIVVNDIGAYLARHVKHWVTLHPEYLESWMTLRLGHNLGSGYRPKTHSHQYNRQDVKNVDYRWLFGSAGATSGFFAIAVGLCLGYERLVVLGCPADGSGRFFDPPGVGGVHGDDHVVGAWKAEINQNPEIKKRVRSTSGMTREVLGGPEV